MELQVVREATSATVRLGGDLVAATVTDLRPRLRDLVQDGVTDLALDFAGTLMVDSAGIGLLMATHNTLLRAGGRLSVVHASPEIRDLFQWMRLNQHFTVTDA